MDSSFGSSFIRFARGNAAKPLALQIPYMGKEFFFHSFEFGRYSHQSAFVHTNKTSHHSAMWQSVFQKCPSSGGTAGTSGEESGHQSSAWLSNCTAPGACSRTDRDRGTSKGTNSLMKCTDKKWRASHTQCHTVLRSSRSVLHTLISKLTPQTHLFKHPKYSKVINNIHLFSSPSPAPQLC